MARSFRAPRLVIYIRYKAEWYGTSIIEADWFYPSSKTCFDCDHVNKSLGSEERWACPECGTIHDRDLNAARNLLKLALGIALADVTPADLKALARRLCAPGETGGDDARKKDSAPIQLALMAAG